VKVHWVYPSLDVSTLLRVCESLGVSRSIVLTVSPELEAKAMVLVEQLNDPPSSWVVGRLLMGRHRILVNPNLKPDEWYLAQL